MRTTCRARGTDAASWAKVAQWVAGTGRAPVGMFSHSRVADGPEAGYPRPAEVKPATTSTSPARTRDAPDNGPQRAGNVVRAGTAPVLRGRELCRRRWSAVAAACHGGRTRLVLEATSR
ncbi:hypothetical protein GCM10027519_21600 [Kineococcus endophyticus]